MRRHSPVKACLFISTAIVVGLGTSAQAQEEAAGTFLGRLVVSAGAPKVAIEVPQSVTVIDAEEINEAQPATVGDVLAQAPGVSTVGSESRFGESINIRGIGQGASADEPRIINLIDGVKKYYESYRQGSLFTDPEFFKSVEILRGPGSSTLYGSGAVGGVIAFETKDASDFLEDEDDTFALSQELEYKSNGGGKESATFLAFSPDQRFDVLIGFIYDESDFLKDGSGNDIFGTRVAETNLLVKGTYSFGDSLEHSVEAGFIRYEGSADDQLLDVIDNVATFGTVDRTVTDTTAYARYEYNPAGNDLVDLDVQLSYSKSENAITDFVYTPSPFFNLGIFDADYSYESYSLRAVNTASWGGETTENYLSFGAELYEQERISIRATADNAAFQPTGTTTSLGVFAQNEWIWNDRLTVLAGARLEFQDTAPGALVPTTLETSDQARSATLALHHQTTDQIALFGSVAYTERLPVVDELYDSRPTTSGADQISAGTLSPEKSLNFEIGASFAASDVFTPGDALDLKGTVFRHSLTDLIARNNTGVAGDPTYVNIDEARFTGFELEGAYEADRFFGALALTVLDGKNVSDPTDINPNLENRIPANTLRLTLGTRLPEQNLEFGWTGTYYDAKSRYQSSMGMVSEIATPSELIHDIYAAWTPDTGVWDGAEIRLGISNVMDTDYRTHLQSTSIRRAGRSINLSVSKTF